MSSRWPSSLLNATNKRLTERIEQLTLDLDTKRNSVAEQREVLGLLKKHQHEAQQQVKAIAEALERERAAVENDEDKLKQLQLEAEADARRARQSKEAETQLSQAVSALESTLDQRYRALSGQREIAVELEEEAKELVSAHLSRQRVGDDLAAAQRELSSTVWATLARLNEQVRVATQRLEEARGERLHVLQEVDAMHLALQHAVKDQAESLRALELVYVQTSQLDAQVLGNAKSMEVLVAAAREREKLRGELQATLERLRRDNQRQALTHDLKREQYDKQVRALQKTVAALREDEEHSMISRRCEEAEVQQLCQQRRELEHVILLCEEKRQLLAQQQARRDALEGARALMQRQESTGQPSPAALGDMILALEQQEAQLEDRVRRTCAKLTEAIQTFMDEGRRSEHFNAAVADKMKAKLSLVSDQEASEGHVQLLKERSRKLEESLAERQALFSSMQALTLEQRAQRQASWLREIEQLRGTLLRVQRDHQQLLHGTATLRSSWHHTRKTLEEKGMSQGKVLNDLRLLEGEVFRLDQEMTATAEEHNSRLLQHEQAGVTLQSLMRAADGQVSGLKEAAGTEAYIRAEVQIVEERIQADMQGALVELHLNGNEVHELSEELQRHRKKLNLLRLRYEEAMMSMARAAQKPLSEEEGRGIPLPLLNSESDTCTPEAVHAHLLLRRSYEREQLMQRGNYLDLRLVALDRETSTLRHMVDGMRSSQVTSGQANALGELSSTAKKAGASSIKNCSSQLEPSAPSCSPTLIKKELLSSAEASEHFWRAELQLLDETLAAMSQQRDDSRVRLHEMRATLKELQDTERQKRMQVQKLRDSVQRSRKLANVVSVKCSR
ncbi:conserved hypothetical protein [Leishmania mexicana MHOM/GT/2001/U1103]|uniref:Uncharacterized protein n=1 Tax=Leishmania mexicana (strain MHOM/GT/2001/U1103) TaxID=929439 RepID=E9B603_LEIMU|nr:conserved hypothetical protein [Leishmania mexicana MHOM/GT/2001/U1103]CBZ30674.1 conserved hypothetical protein [Leishmania mexicana MHOM/GT/2001/U1103]